MTGLTIRQNDYLTNTIIYAMLYSMSNDTDIITAVDTAPGASDGDWFSVIDDLKVKGRLPNTDTINRSKMSRMLRIDVAHISRIFSGKSSPSLKLAIRIAKYLEITVEELNSVLPKKVLKKR